VDNQLFYGLLLTILTGVTGFTGWSLRSMIKSKMDNFTDKLELILKNVDTRFSYLEKSLDDVGKKIVTTRDAHNQCRVEVIKTIERLEARVDSLNNKAKEK